MPALSFGSIYDPPSFLPQPPAASLGGVKMQYAVSHSPPALHASPPPPPSSASPHHLVRRVSHPSQQQQQQAESLVYAAHSPPLPHSPMQPHSHVSNGQSVYVVPSHSYSPPVASFQSYHNGGHSVQPHSPTHAGAFRPFKAAPLSPPSAVRSGSLVYSYPPSALQPPTGSPSSPVPAATSSQPTIFIHPTSYSHPAPSYPRLLSSPIPHSPSDAVVRPLAVRRTGSPPLSQSALLTVPAALTSQASCPTCSHHSHAVVQPQPHPHSQLHPPRSLSTGPTGSFVMSSAQYHSMQPLPQHTQHQHHFHPLPHAPSHSQPHLSHHQSHRVSPACLAAGCTYPVSPRSDSRMLAASDDEDAYSHHSQHSHLSLPSSTSSSSSHSLGQPRYSSAHSSFIHASSSAPPTHPHSHYVVAGSYGYSPPVPHPHLQLVSSQQQPTRVGLPSHVQYGAPPPGTAYTVQSIPVATLSPQSASPSSASSTSSSLSGPFPSAASSTSGGSSSQSTAASAASGGSAATAASASSSSSSAPSSPRAKSKRSAAHMREFVRSYFLRNSANLVNKDLTSISAELQAAYERESASGEGAADSLGDRKPVFCRTFIQKVARSLGFILTLHFGLVDKRMKHLMKIRKRGKKNTKKHSSNSHSAAAAAAAAERQRAEAAQHQPPTHSQPVKHEQQSHLPLAHALPALAALDAVPGPSDRVVEAEVAAAAAHMEEMAAAFDARMAASDDNAAGSVKVEAAVGGSGEEGAEDDDDFDDADLDNDSEDGPRTERDDGGAAEAVAAELAASEGAATALAGAVSVALNHALEEASNDTQHQAATEMEV